MSGQHYHEYFVLILELMKTELSFGIKIFIHVISRFQLVNK